MTQALLSQAAIVYVPWEQIAVLPRKRNWDEEARAVFESRPPFPVTFLAIGGKWRDLEQGWAETPLYAALLLDRDCPVRLGIPGSATEVVPFFCSEQFEQPLSVGVGAPSSGEMHAVNWVDPSCSIPNPDHPSFHTVGEEVGEKVSAGTATALRAMFLLESANVDLVPGRPAPATHRAAGAPAYEVVVRQRSSTSQDRGGKVDWSHRWEVRGHYKHFHSGAIFEKHADRQVIDASGRRCVRIWSPPHVKGPEDKPFIPKPRVVVSA